MFFSLIPVLLGTVVILSSYPPPGAPWFASASHQIFRRGVESGPGIYLTGYMSEKISGKEIVDGQPTFMKIADATKRAVEYLRKGKEPVCDQPFMGHEYPNPTSSTCTDKVKQYLEAMYRYGYQSGRLRPVRIVEEGERGGSRGPDSGKSADQPFSKDKDSFIEDRRQGSATPTPSKSEIEQTQASEPSYEQVRILEAGATCPVCLEGYRNPTTNGQGGVRWNWIYNCDKCSTHYHHHCLKRRYCPKCNEQVKTKSPPLWKVARNALIKPGMANKFIRVLRNFS
ncbi:hypothetical protein PTTG_27526 [Puccinia triticina 1-1 BBBD Race 1]|uniref:Phorbol-ester/DAG-type domain-containing protein n=2 Tax=Puccinia triticina TaxID=208348 RepID=A0A180GJB9_PUCT1|nr:uncharacterized protein PtA15_3A444 [Puccinia triticina]OAV92755.1 hypothetical protein PTTG_27526 [Puccinia triticina 1-1 BBBD Race 1]WAQ83077.1 hypothetical protein PtA15_3A444 [Puccinia triticina]WAR53916.1 hypothetical protein PtB15_3B425 [Puccinia triticina]